MSVQHEPIGGTIMDDADGPASVDFIGLVSFISQAINPALPLGHAVRRCRAVPDDLEYVRVLCQCGFAGKLDEMMTHWRTVDTPLIEPPRLVIP